MATQNTPRLFQILSRTLAALAIIAIVSAADPDPLTVNPNGTVVVGADPGGSELFRVGGTSRLNGIALGSRSFASATSFGYSPAWKSIILGSTGSTYGLDSVTLAFGVDPSVIPGGSYQGKGDELLFRRNMQFLQPNSVSTDWELAGIQMGSIVVGADPGGSERLRVSGSIRASGALSLNGNQSLGLKVDVEGTISRYGVGFFSNAGRATTGVACNTAYGASGVSLGGWDGSTFTEYLRTGPSTGGAVVVGNDPGGVELLRVGGAIRATGSANLGGALSINDGFAPVAGDLGLGRSATQGAMYFGTNSPERYLYGNGNDFELRAPAMGTLNLTRLGVRADGDVVSGGNLAGYGVILSAPSATTGDYRALGRTAASAIMLRSYSTNEGGNGNLILATADNVGVYPCLTIQGGSAPYATIQGGVPGAPAVGEVRVGGGQIKVGATTTSTSTTTGALTVAGGAGVGGAINALEFTTASGALRTSVYPANITFTRPNANSYIDVGGVGGSLLIRTSSTNSLDKTAMTVLPSGYVGIGVLPGAPLDVMLGATGRVRYSTDGTNGAFQDMVSPDATAWTKYTARATEMLFLVAASGSPSGGIKLTPTAPGAPAATDVLVGAGAMKIGATTASTSTTTGALTVAGGVGIAKELRTGGAVFVKTLRCDGTATLFTIVNEEAVVYSGSLSAATVKLPPAADGRRLFIRNRSTAASCNLTIQAETGNTIDSVTATTKVLTKGTGLTVIAIGTEWCTY